MLWYQRSLRWEFTFRWALSGGWVVVSGKGRDVPGEKNITSKNIAMKGLQHAHGSCKPV